MEGPGDPKGFQKGQPGPEASLGLPRHPLGFQKGNAHREPGNLRASRGNLRDPPVGILVQVGSMLQLYLQEQNFNLNEFDVS